MVDDRSNAKQSWRTTIVLLKQNFSHLLANFLCLFFYLEMPEQESEDETNTESHEPGHEQERTALEVVELLQDSHPLWHFPHCLRKHLGLKKPYVGTQLDFV